MCARSMMTGRETAREDPGGLRYRIQLLPGGSDGAHAHRPSVPEARSPDRSFHARFHRMSWPRTTPMFSAMCAPALSRPPGESKSARSSSSRIADCPMQWRRMPHRCPSTNYPIARLMYLLGSRYCDTQKLSDLAWSTFGHVDGGWQRVQAICDYVHDRIQFGYRFARSDRTASEGHQERIGVCRDFAHLAVALCRCVNIPARYCTGYLGDIGVPHGPSADGFQCVVRSLYRRALVYVRRSTQSSPHWSNCHCSRARRRRRRYLNNVWPNGARAFLRFDRRDPLGRDVPPARNEVRSRNKLSCGVSVR